VVTPATLVYRKSARASEMSMVSRMQILVSHWNTAAQVVVPATLAYCKPASASETVSFAATTRLPHFTRTKRKSRALTVKKRHGEVEGASEPPRSADQCSNALANQSSRSAGVFRAILDRRQGFRSLVSPYPRNTSCRGRHGG
jgi:hypothetical protein